MILFFFKQKTAYEVRISDWSSDVCSSDLLPAADVPPYDREVYQREVGLLTEWYCPAIGLPVDEVGYAAAWDAVLPIVERSASPVVTVLRDYHAENIMLIDRAESHGLGLLDFQDALAGHPAYDLVSLLQDARRDVSPALEAAMIADRESPRM